MEFHERIQKVLELRGMTQAEVCRITGLSSAKVSQVVSGSTKDPRISTIVPIAQALSVSLDYLVFGQSSASPFTSDAQTSLNKNYESMNETGRARLAEQAEMMVSSGMFEKSEDNKVSKSA